MPSSTGEQSRSNERRRLNFRRGNVLYNAVHGQINSNSKLSANPDLQLTFSNPKIMSNCAFHPCIRYQKWEQNKVLSFIPPDGHFRLLEYEMEGKAQLPLSIRPSVTVEENGGGSFQVRRGVAETDRQASSL